MRTGDFSATLPFRRCLPSGLVIEFSLSLLVKHAIASAPATAHVHPVGWEDDDRPWAEIPGRCQVRPGVQDAADDHHFDLAAMCVQRIVSSGWYLTHLRELSRFRVARKRGELRAFHLGQFGPLYVREGHHQRRPSFVLRRARSIRPVATCGYRNAHRRQY